MGGSGEPEAVAGHWRRATYRTYVRYIDECEDAEIERRSQGMVDGVKPVRYWRQRPNLEQLAERVVRLEQRVAELERRLPGLAR